jgi:hypothetical protein
MTDRGSFKVQSDLLRDHAKLWHTREADANAAKQLIADGVGMGYKFGFLAGQNHVSDYYDKWSTAMSKALDDAAKSFRYLDAALNSTANDYDGTDSTVATDFSRLDGMI